MVLTIAEQLRRKADHKTAPTSAPSATTFVDDSEIARLERELALSASDSDEDSSSSYLQIPPFQESAPQKWAQRINLSTMKDVTIAPLPTRHLPTIAKKRTNEDGENIKTKKKKKKKKKKASDSSDADIAPVSADSTKDRAPNPHVVSAGMSSTIAALTYQPRSETSLPFFCRRCTHQADDLEGFNAHMVSEEHLEMQRVWERGLECGVCGKKFNSKVQMEEHLESKAHVEAAKGRGGRGMGGRGIGGGRGMNGRGMNGRGMNGRGMNGRGMNGRGFGSGRGGGDKRQWG